MEVFMTKRLTGFIHLFITAAVLMAGGRSEKNMGPSTIVDVAVKDGHFKTLVAALKAADLDGVLMGEGPFTVFAPTDKAFAKLPAGTVDSLLKDIPTLKKILLYHVAAGKMAAADVAKVTSVPTVNGLPVMVKVSGSTVKINDSVVQIADIAASNGLIHVVDTVILPPSGDLVDTAMANGNFKTLLTAAAAAGLVDTLKGAGPFTLFAPTDEAFAKLPAGTVEGLLKDIPTLKKILTYHVVSGRVYASDVAKMNTAPSVQGSSITIKVDMDSVKLNGSSMVTNADILTTNGVIHVIDSVLLPK
jgi:transforming growth factor-beta-induced protein